MSRVIGRLKRGVFAVAAAAALAGCVDPLSVDSQGRAEPLVTKAAMPSAVQRPVEIDDVLLCIRETRVLAPFTFSVGSFADSTGKINAVADGATGNFLPQGGSAAYITDALRRAGGRVISTYFGPPETPERAHYAVNGIFNTLDFGRVTDVDVRIDGIGPMIASGWAQLSLTIQLDEASTRVNRQMSMIQRPLRYQLAGFSVGRTFGDILASGAVSIQNQERMQFEALNGPIALGIVDVLMKEFPTAADACGAGVAALLEDRPAG